MRMIIQGPENAFFNMALDESISEAVREHSSPPTLRLYRWDTPSLSIGHFQKISDIDTDYCSSKNYPVVRRQTGGRAILHDEELTYSLSAPKGLPMFGESLMENYTMISRALIAALHANNISARASFERKKGTMQRDPACFKAVSFAEITIDGKKLIGSAQKRFSNGFMQHGSILFDLDTVKLSRILRYKNSEEFSGIGTMKEYAPELSYEDLAVSLKSSFEKTLGVKLITDNPTKQELNMAGKLQKEKYSSKKWNHKK